ncbi:MAG: hypothetical protein IPM34_03905 [Saprospiraceae bacterium]|nr:hypothetical protein [Saprospiraceae bacterium]
MATILILANNCLQAQQLDTTDRKVQVIHADVFRFERYRGRELQYLSKDVLVKHRGSYLLCDSAMIDSNKVTAMGHVRIIEGDSLQLFGDSLYYDGDKRLANFKGNIVLKHKDQQLFTEAIEYDLNSRISNYQSGGILYSEQAKLRSKKGYYHAKTGEAFFKDSVVVLLQDRMKLLSDTLLYQTREKKVVFIGPTLIEQDSLQIYTDQGYYLTEQQKSYFGNSPRYIKGSQRADARHIYHDALNKVVTLVGQANIKDETQEAKADSIIFNEANGDVLLYENAFYKEGERILEGQIIEYNRYTKSLKVRGNPRVLESGREIQASSLKYDGKKDLGTANGAVVVTDTAEGYSIVCDSFSYSKSRKMFSAIGRHRRPYFVILFDNDSLYLAADSLFSEQLKMGSDSFQTISAWGKVKIWSEQLRGTCDSLYFSGQDSTFYLYDHPVMWSDSSQMTGDTIRLVLQNKSMKDFYLSPNGFIINREFEVIDNQIKGRSIQGHFEHKKIEYMYVEGNAESVYFIKDGEDAFLGTNIIQCSQMKFQFNEDKKVDFIDFFIKPQGQILPLSEGKKKFLEGYSPRYQEKPESLEAIIKWN